MKKLLIAICLLPLAVIAQKVPLWKLERKNKVVEWQTISDTATISLKPNTKGKLNISYLYPEKMTKSNQSIILMDEGRQEISRIPVQENKAVINIHQLFIKSNKKPVYLYTITLSKDFNTARRARVGTVFIGKLNWGK